MKNNQNILNLIDLFKGKGKGDLKVWDKNRTVFELKLRGNTLTIETHAPKASLSRLLETLEVQAQIEDTTALRRATISLKEVL